MSTTTIDRPAESKSRRATSQANTVALTKPAHDLASQLDEHGAYGTPIDLPNDLDRVPLIELKRKGVIKNIGGARGKPGKIQLIIPRDHLVLSQRKRTSRRNGTASSGRSTASRVIRPSLEEMQSLIEAILVAERELHQSTAQAAQRKVSEIKHALVDAEPGSEYEQDLAENLIEEMSKLKSLAAEVRAKAFKQIEDSAHPSAAYISLLSSNRQIS